MHATTPDNPASDLVAERRAELRGVIALTVPMVITFSSRAVMDIVDYMMITGLGDPHAQAALLPAQMAIWTYLILGLGIVSLVSTFASQSLGRDRPEEGSIYAWQAVYVAVVFGVVGLALQPVVQGIIHRFGHEPGVQALELTYSRIALHSAAPTIAAYGLGWFFVGVHRPWTTMWSAIEANVVNTAVSYVLIFGHLGFEPMGIAGAAWGTVAAVTYRSVRLILTMLAPRAAAMYNARQTWRFSWTHMRNLVRIGLPCGLQWLCDVAVWTIFVNLLIGAKFGTVELIATNIAWQFMRLAFLPALGVGQALTALVGKSIGAGDPERAMRETRIGTLIALGYMVFLSLVYTLFAAPLIGLFSDDPAVVSAGRKIMYCAACFQLFDAVAICYTSSLRGAGDTFVPSVFFIISNWLIIVGGGWFVVTWFPELEALGPWLAASSLIMITATFLWWRWHRRSWMNIDLLGRTGVKTESAQ